MAGYFADGFDNYSASADITRNWNGGSMSGWTYNSTGGILGGGCIRAASVASPSLYTPALFNIGQGTQVGGAGWFKASAAPASNSSSERLLGLVTNALGNAGPFINISTTGVLLLKNASNSTILTGSTNVCDNAWHFLEFSLAMQSGTTAVCRLYVDTVMNWNGSFTTPGFNGNAVGWFLGCTSNASNTYTWDDLFFFDNASPSPQVGDFPMGGKLNTTLRPASDILAQFTPLTGPTNYPNVNEQAPDEDTSYVQSGTSGQADEYLYGALGFNPISISMVQLVTRVKNPSGGTITYKERCHSGATTSDGPAITAPASYQNSRRILNQDPNTSSAWTPSNLASAKFGYTVP